MTRLSRIRLAIVFVMFGLFVAGVTAFPLLVEIRWVTDLMLDPGASLDAAAHSGLMAWLLTVRAGLEETYAKYPWVAYGTDWLAFGHLMIMLFFILPYRDPIRYEGVLWVGVWMSVLVVPLAFVCGAVRGIPWWWSVVDCGFGVGCLPLLGWAIWEVRAFAKTRAGSVVGRGFIGRRASA